MRTVKKGDYILITDQSDNCFLKIGEVTHISYYPDGDIREYTIMFGFDYKTRQNDYGWYTYDLPERCRVLTFENR